MNRINAKNYAPLLVIVLLSFLAWTIQTSCTPRKKAPDWVTDTPTLKFVKMSDSIFHFSDPNQYFIIEMIVYDKDQDLGTNISDTAITVRDYRSDSLYATYKLGFPMIDKTLIDNDYLEAGIKVRLPPGAIRPRTDPIHLAARKDTCYLMIDVTDESGKKSNEVKTPTIYIKD